MGKVDRFPPGPVEDELQGLFDTAYQDGYKQPAEVEGLWQRLVVVLAMPMPQPTGAAGPPASGWLSASGVKGVLALVIGGVAAAGIVAGVHAGIATSTPAPTALAGLPSGAGAAPASARPAVADPAPLSPPAPETSAVDPSTLPAVLSGSTGGPLDRGKSAAHAKVLPGRRGSGASPVDPAPASMTSPGTAQDTSAPATPATSTPATSTPAAQPAPARADVPPAADAAPTEGALLLRARRALASDPATSLALTEEAARRYPRGDLAPEREVLAIEALAALKRRSEARARLDAFEQRYPGSLPTARLERLLSE